jgi:hypothetical protein
MKIYFKQLVRVVALIASFLIQLQFVVDADKKIRFTPNCLCPSKDKFPLPVSNGINQVAWCGYELGPKCDVQRGYICDINMANKEGKFATLNCLGGGMYCVPYEDFQHVKSCGSKIECETIPSCKKSLNATVIALENLRKTYGQNSTTFRRVGS